MLDLGALQGWRVKNSWTDGASARLMQLPAQQVSRIPCRHPRLGSAQLLCSCISLVQQQQLAGPCRWAQRDSLLPSAPELRLSSHKAGFYGPPRECEHGCVCVQSQGFTTHPGIAWGQRFQMLYPEAWIHWAFGLF